MSRSIRSAQTLVTGAGLTVVNLALGFAAAPYLLRTLGADRFGALRTLLDLAGYAALFDFGVSGALLGSLAPAAARGDEGGVRDAMAAGLRAYSRCAFLLVAAGIPFALLAPNLRPFAGFDSREIALAAAFLLAPWALMPLAAFRLLAESRQQGWIVNALTGAQAISTLLLQTAAAHAGWGLPGQTAAVAVAQVPTSAVLFWMGRRHATLRAGAPLPRAEYGASFFVQAASRVSLMSDTLLVGWVLGPAAVAAFALTQRMPSMVQAQLQGVGNATWAALMELHAQGHGARLRARLEELTALVSSLGIAVLIPLAIANGALVESWVGRAGWAGTAASTLACVNAWLWAVSSLWGWPLSAGGFLRRWAPYAGAALAVNVAVSVAGIFAIGAAGPLLGTVCGFALVNSWALPRVLQGAMGVSPAGLYHAALSPFRWGVPFAAAAWWWWTVCEPSGASAWIHAALQAACGLGCWWWFGLNRDARRAWIERASMAVPARQHA